MQILASEAINLFTCLTYRMHFCEWLQDSLCDAHDHKATDSL